MLVEYMYQSVFTNHCDINYNGYLYILYFVKMFVWFQIVWRKYERKLDFS